MKIKRFLKLGMVIAILTLTALTTIPPASAARMNVSRQLCDLAVFPFNSSGTPLYENALLPFIKYVNNTVCKAHLTIPTNTPFTAQSYNPQPVAETNDIKILDNAAAKHGPTAQHEHNYYNDSLEDNFYYESFVAKFAIDFAPDTKVNINNVTCITPYPSWWQRYDQNGNDKLDPIKDCQGTVSDLWGGTSVTKNTNGVIWSFGTNNNGADMPKIFGKNPTLDPLIGGGFNSSIDANREFGANVNLTTPGPANSNDKLWSATTSSRILVRDFSIKKTNDMTKLSRFCTTAGDYDYGWCSLPSLAGYEVATPFGSKPFYWFPIGTTSIVWEKSASDEQTTCAALNWEITQNGQVVNAADVVADTPMTIKVTPTYNPSNKTVPLKYRWSAGTWGWIFFPQGQFRDNTASNPDLGNPYQYDDDNTIYYTGGPKGTHLYVNTYYVSDGKIADPCNKELEITKETPPDAECTGITLTPDYVNAPGQTNYTAKVTFSDGKSYNTTVNWSGTNGTFTKPANETQMSGVSPNLYQYTNTYNTSATTDSVTAKVTAVQGAANSAICQNGVKVQQKPEKPKCVSVNLSPNTLTAPGSTPLTATVTYSNGQSYNTELTWSQSNGDLINDEVQQHQSSQEFTNTYITNNNSGSVTVKVTKILDPNVENSDDCKEGMSISNGGGNPYCVDLIVTPGQLNGSGSTNMSATAVFNNGGTYDTTVQWGGSNGTYPPNTTTQTHDSGDDFLNTFTIADDQDPASAWVRVIDVPDPEADNGQGCLDAKYIYTPPEKDRCRDINVFRYHDQYCVEVTAGDYDGRFTWVFDGVKQTPTYACVTIPAGANWRVYATGEPNNKNCQAEGKTEKRPPRVSKGVRATARGGNYVNVISIPSNQTEIDYRITFNADSSSKTTATIIDDISDGSIDGETKPVDTGTAGHIDYITGSQSVDRPRCSAFITENCFTGDIGNGGITLVKVTGQVTITYKGVVNDSAITPEVCVEGKICQEKYTNSARVDYQIFDDDDNVIDTGRLTSNETLVQIFCQYILTRAAGDIYLESDLNAGVDIRMCSKYTSTTGVLVVPGEPTKPELGKTGLPSEIMSLSHEICTAGQSGSIPDALKPFYGQTVVQNLSSQICEVKLQPGTAWQQKTITNDIEENKTRISRWEPDYSGMSVSMSSIKLDSLYGDKKVYHIKDGNLTIDQLYTLSDGEGAKTFIVENGDLYINNDITYGTCLPQNQPCTINDIASLAFIVLNGSVYIDPSVTEMSGVYFVQEGDRADSGRLYSLNNEPSYDKLVIYGSVYGDIEPLFLNRLFAGDPTLEEAGIVVRFDQRIILNTPTGLRDIMSYSASEVAR